FRKRDSSALWSSCDTVVPSPVPIAVRKPRSDACPVPRLGAPARRTTRYREASVRYFVVLYINSGPFRIRSTTPMGAAGRVIDADSMPAGATFAQRLLDARRRRPPTQSHRLPMPAHPQVQHLDRQREEHREVDVALRDVEIDALRDQH